MSVESEQIKIAKTSEAFFVNQKSAWELQEKIVRGIIIDYNTVLDGSEDADTAYNKKKVECGLKKKKMEFDLSEAQIAATVLDKANANSSALLAASEKLEEDGASERDRTKAKLEAEAAAEQAEEYKKTAQDKNAKATASSEASVTCHREMAVLEQNSDYQDMIKTAAKKAAVIQIQATCRAE